VHEALCFIPRNPTQKKPFFITFIWGEGVNSGLPTCKAGTLLLESHLQSILLWLS
jgi:hypothetical protein